MTRPQADLPQTVTIIEVGMRDGLQHEPEIVPTDEKVALIHDLVDAGLTRIQVASFVHPELVPQMADAEEVCARIQPREGVEYSGLALNMKGVERAYHAGLKSIDISISASDNHSRRNAGMSVQEALGEFESMVKATRNYGMFVRGGIQCAFGYRNPDDVTAADVLALVRRYLTLGIDELAIADSAGLANPSQMRSLLDQVMPLAGDIPIVLHLHDTRGMGIANAVAALDAGVRRFDTSFGGMGGCPFIDGAAGNIATEDTVYMLHSMGYRTGIDLRKVAAIIQRLAGVVSKESLSGKLYELLINNPDEALPSAVN